MKKLTRRRKKKLLRIGAGLIAAALIILAVILGARSARKRSLEAEELDAKKHGVVLVYTAEGECTKEELLDTAAIMEKRAKLYSENATCVLRGNGDLVVKIPTRGGDHIYKDAISLINVQGKLEILDEDNENTRTLGNDYNVLWGNDSVESAEALTETDSTGYSKYVLNIKLGKNGTNMLSAITSDTQPDTFTVLLDGAEIGTVYEGGSNTGGLLRLELGGIEEANRYADILSSGVYPVKITLMVQEVNE